MNLRLKRLELLGFKSFADKTALDFDGSFTGIVGPNGCGKSNVVDAIRWVLGEMRAKSMRGGEMADVVFKGSVSRPAQSFAEVSMVLDNSTGAVENAGPEFSITRRISTDGEGEYLINGERARLKDIKDMLFDTGLGSRGYSVLEQGRIDAVLSANPLERRSIFEEAAGISRYRQRKKEAEARLSRVEQDVARVDDVLRELASRVRSLKLQASKAEKYVSVRDEWKRERTRFLRHKVHALNGRLEEVQRNMSALEERARELRDARVETDADTQRREGLQRELVARVEELAAVVAQLAGEGRALDERHEQLSARIEGWRATVSEESRRVESLGGQLEERTSELELVDQELAARRTRLAEVEERARAAGTALRDARASYRDVRERSEELNQGVLGLLHEKTAAQNRVHHLDASRAPLAGRRQRALARLAESREAVLSVRRGLEEAREEREQCEAKLAAVESDRAAARLALESVIQERAELAQRKALIELEIARLQSRLATLRDWERERTSLESGARALLESFESDSGDAPVAPVEAEALLGLFADRVRVSTRYARSLDVALGPRALALVARSRESVAPILSWLAHNQAGEVELLLSRGLADLSRGRAERRPALEPQRSSARPELDALALFAAEQRSPADAPAPPAELAATDADFIVGFEAPFELRAAAARDVRGGRSDLELDERIEGRLADLATCDPGFEDLVEALIGDVWVARDLEAALELVERHPALRFATASGDLVAATGVLGGHREVAQGAIGRRSSAVELEEVQLGLVAELAALDGRDALVADEIDVRRRELARCESQFEIERLAASDAHAGERAQGARLADLESTLAIVAGEEARIAREAEQLEVEIAEAQAGLEATEERFRAENEKLSALERERHESERVREESAQAESREQVELARERAEVAALEQRRVDLERARRENAGEVERARRLAEEARAQAERAAGDVEALAAKSSAMADERAAREVELQEQRALDQQGRVAIEELRRELESVTRGLEETMEAISQRQLDEQRFALSRDELLGRSNEELELSEAELLAGFEPEEELSVPEALAALDERVTALRRELDRLGPVNTDALADLEETQTRLDFLEGQRRDLAEARSTLLSTLQTINEESCRRFLETFEEVREAFSKLFRQLFGGGRADLALEEGVDPLEAGIEITARPPGREMLPIGLLSGGQRTMTALGLLFAVFQTRPSPFCVLDEVDAALDDANVGRFLAMLDGFRDSTQFIVVTHNKGTMSACDVLYGITMETKGVSRHVSVQFGEVDRFVPEVTGNADVASESRDRVRSGQPAVDGESVEDEQDPVDGERGTEREVVLQPRPRPEPESRPEPEPRAQAENGAFRAHGRTEELVTEAAASGGAEDSDAGGGEVATEADSAQDAELSESIREL